MPVKTGAFFQSMRKTTATTKSWFETVDGIGGRVCGKPNPSRFTVSPPLACRVGNHTCVFLGQKTNRNVYELSLSSVSHLGRVLIILSFLEAVKLEKSFKIERKSPSPAGTVRKGLTWAGWVHAHSSCPRSCGCMGCVHHRSVWCSEWTLPPGPQPLPCDSERTDPRGHFPCPRIPFPAPHSREPCSLRCRRRKPLESWGGGHPSAGWQFPGRLASSWGWTASTCASGQCCRNKNQGGWASICSQAKQLPHTLPHYRPHPSSRLLASAAAAHMAVKAGRRLWKASWQDLVVQACHPSYSGG